MASTPVISATGNRYSINLISAISPCGEPRRMEIEERATVWRFLFFLAALTEGRRERHAIGKQGVLSRRGARAHRARSTEVDARSPGNGPSVLRGAPLRVRERMIRLSRRWPPWCFILFL